MSERRPEAVLREWFDALASGVRLGQFASVGVVGAVFDNLVLTVLQLGTGLPTIVSKAAGIETAILVMFLVNERWTFADEGKPGRRNFLRRLGRSHVVRAGGVTVQLVVFSLLYYGLDVQIVIAGENFWFLGASIISIAVAMIVNYCFECLFTWRIHQ